MANNIDVTQGSGKTVATEDVGGAQFQKVEIYGRGGASVLGINPDGSINASIVGTVNIAGSVIAVVTSNPNQSVSGAVNVSGSVMLGSSNASVITVNQSSSIIAVVTGSVVGVPSGNQSVSGALNVSGSVMLGSSNASIIAVVSGSIAAIVTPVANQSVSGAINVSGSVLLGSSNASVITFFQNSSILSVPVGSTVAVLQSSSIIAVVTGSVVTIPTGNQSVSGALFISGSVLAQLTGTVITSMVSTVPSSVIVGASIFGQLPGGTAVLGSIATLQGTNPWITQPTSGSIAAIQSGTWSTSVMTNVITSIATAGQVMGSVATLQGTNPWLTRFGNSSIIAINAGSVVALSQGSVITVFQAPSIVGTYAEDATHTTADKGIFVLGVRNDAVASFAAANLEYGPQGTDSAGRMLTKPFAAEEARVEGYHSVVSTSVTTLVAAAGAGLKNYITDVVIANTGATTTLITFRSGGGTSVLGYAIAPAGGGSNMIGWVMPMRTLANETFDFQPTAASSIIFVKVSGFKAP